MELLPYLLKLTAYWLVLYLCYALWLRRQTFLRWNRAYLLGSLVAGFVLPLVTYPEAAPPMPVVYEVTMTAFTVAIVPSPSLLTWENAMWAAYFLGVMFMLGRLFRHFHQLFSFIRQGESIEMDDHTLVLLDDNRVGEASPGAAAPGEASPGAAAPGSFSFLRWIVISRSDYEDNFDTILNHELVHLRQRHSWDVIFLEILQVVFWFNPILIIYKKTLQQVHEFLADEQAKADNRDRYAEFLVSYALNSPTLVLSNQFFNNSFLKNRIAMLYKNKNSQWSLGKYAAVALFIGLTALTVASCEREITPSAANGEEMVKGNVSLEGIVTGPDGKPLEGVSIIAADGKKGTTTNAAGKFEMKAAPGTDLQIDYPGFSGFKFNISPKFAKNNIVIKMEPGSTVGNMTKISTLSADGKVLNLTFQPATTDGETIFMVVENQPEFPGGRDEMFKYLGQNIKYPEAAAKANVTGKVFVNFVVTTEGEIKDITILKGIGFGADAEAVRVVKNMPRWKPGMQSGRAVNVRYNLPIAFELEDDKEVKKEKTQTIYPPRVIKGEESDKVGQNDSGTLNFEATDGRALTFSGTPTNTTVTGAEKALVVIDGVVQKAGYDLKKVDPNAIQSINVLKGEKATKAYGDKGANGVVEITIKKKVRSRQSVAVADDYHKPLTFNR